MAKRSPEEQLTKTQPDSTGEYKPQAESDVAKIAGAPKETSEEVAKRKLFTPLKTDDEIKSETAKPPLFSSTGTGTLFGSTGGGLFGTQPGSLFGGPKPQEQPSGSIFGGGLFGAGSSLFGSSTLQPGSFGATAQVTNPFASYNLANLGKKEGGEESEGEEGEEEKRPPSPETFKAGKAEGQKVPAMSLEASPYTKLVSLEVVKFKVEKSGRGAGFLSIEEGTANDKPIALLVFRNKFGSVMYQGQLLKNVSRITKKTPPKPHKIQRMITVVGKKEAGGQGLVKCTITFKDEQDCTKFRETFAKAVNALPEIVKAPEKSKVTPEKKTEEKPTPEKKTEEKPKETQERKPEEKPKEEKVDGQE